MKSLALNWTSHGTTERMDWKTGDYGPIDVVLASSQPSVEIINTPECIGTDFQSKLSAAIRNAVELLLEGHIGRVLTEHPIDVVYVLRGGLNFDLHNALWRTIQKNAEVSFISSQRIERDGGFQIGESGYSKWSLQNASVLCIGDICATGTTMKHVIDAAVSRYASEEKIPRYLLVFSIGTGNLMDVLADAALTLTRLWGNLFEGITAVYLEGIFTLYCSNPLLAESHLSNTDFFRKAAPRSLRLERDALKSPTTLLERCAIYDGGSRSFEPSTYINNLLRYWRVIQGEAGRLSVRELLALKSDALNYQLPYTEWRDASPWWKDEADIEQMQNIYRAGRSAVEEMVDIGLEELCKRRIEQIQQRNQFKNEGEYDHESY